LIYATQDAKGVEVFKGSKGKAMTVMERARAAADDRHAQKRTKQKSLEFSDEDTPKSRHYDELRTRYLELAKKIVLELLNNDGRVPYDRVWETAIVFPLVWESDIKRWIAEWQTAGKMKIEGLKPRARVPQRNENHTLVWTSASAS
jgi:hypothetical protein